MKRRVKSECILRNIFSIIFSRLNKGIFVYLLFIQLSRKPIIILCTDLNITILQTYFFLLQTKRNLSFKHIDKISNKRNLIGACDTPMGVFLFYNSAINP